MDIVIVTARPDFWLRFSAFLRERHITAHVVDHPDHIAGALEDNPAGDFRLVIIDLPYDFDSMRDYAAQALNLRDNLSVAATHSMPDYLFAQAAAGLRLFPLPRSPREADLEKLLGACDRPGMIRPTDPAALQ
ncbi:MAG: hypothetical protein LBM64_09900 [Deltaproteobacteria bacterium]|nr:hypothetical protein [Deltaproteobacteria bacterium]